MSTTRELESLQTESRNPRSTHIDTVSTLELCHIINNEDGTIADIVKGCVPTIANAIDALVPRVRQGGRVIYVGAGTSGRLGVLDASEIPPTYSAPPSQFVGLIAGGDVALRSAKEGAEDSLEAAVEDLSPLNLDGDKDSLIGIASSGRTPYVLSSLAFAKSKGCVTIGIACSTPSAMSKRGHVDFMIDAVTGPEVLTGSTRMKAGTATKLVLNMLSSGVMIKLGKTFGNIMVDVKPTNVKLEQRARRILRTICGDRSPESDDDLDQELRACHRDVKLTAVKISLGVSIEEAERRLREASGILASVLKQPQGGKMLLNGTGAGNKYVLCVDGGGSKCTAVIRSGTGAIGIGTSGPCNPSDAGTQGAMRAIQAAMQSALDSCDATSQRSIRDLHLTDTWVGVAGGDRKAIRENIRSAMSDLLGNQPDMTLHVTNDIELLATATSHKFESDDITILIAGTGSIAMRYRREGDVLQKVARAGGWGALLGDDGSGFDIGRKAVRLALQQLDDGDIPTTADTEKADPLVGIVSQHFRPTDSSADDTSFLSNALLSASGGEQSASESKQRIASCAKAVIDASTVSSQAKRIVSDANRSLLRLVQSVQKQAAGSKTTLVLVGGLFNSQSIRNSLVEQLEENRIKFSNIRHIDNPALIGAEYLTSCS